jgi:pyridoxal biosynthesis lyase PdxS
VFVGGTGVLVGTGVFVGGTGVFVGAGVVKSFTLAPTQMAMLVVSLLPTKTSWLMT